MNTRQITEDDVRELYDSNKSPRLTSMDGAMYYRIFHNRSGEVTTLSVDGETLFKQLENIRQWLSDNIVLREDEDLLVVYTKGIYINAEQSQEAEKQLLAFLVNMLQERLGSGDDHWDGTISHSSDITIRIYRTWPDTEHGFDVESCVPEESDLEARLRYGTPF